MTNPYGFIEDMVRSGTQRSLDRWKRLLSGLGKKSEPDPYDPQWYWPVDSADCTALMTDIEVAEFFASKASYQTALKVYKDMDVEFVGLKDKVPGYEEYNDDLIFKASYQGNIFDPYDDDYIGNGPRPISLFSLLETYMENSDRPAVAKTLRNIADEIEWHTAKGE